MKENLKALNSKQIKHLIENIKTQFDAEIDLKKYAIYQNKEGKVYILTKEKINSVNFSNLRVNRIGLYFGKEEKDGFRFSIEGAQMVNPKRNFVEIGSEEAKKWMQGGDLDLKADVKGIVIVKFGKDILGCGKYKEGKLLNFVPKDRRIKS